MRFRRQLGFLAALLIPAGGSSQTIEITSLPPYAVDGSIAGVVTGVDFATHRVAVYIQIEGAGWWTKPTFEMPSVPIDSGGGFGADVATTVALALPELARSV